MSSDPYAPPNASVATDEGVWRDRRIRLRVLCLIIGGVPGLVLAAGAAMALAAGSLAGALPLIAWGGLGLIGYAAGLTAIFRLPVLSDYTRRLVIGGIWAGLASLLPLALVLFSSLGGWLLLGGPVLAAALLLQELHRDGR